MDIHKPKPWRGGPEFLKEIGTIVIGVLIALGAEQAVAWIHTQEQVRSAREALRDEIGRNAAYAVEALEAIASSRTIVHAKLRGGPDLIAKARALGVGPQPLPAERRQAVETTCATAGAAPPQWPPGV
jgi:type II secretory pathway pseudopilin PulG